MYRVIISGMKNHNLLNHSDIVLRNSLSSENELRQARLFLQHVHDHDGYLPVGEHIFLKLRAQSADFNLEEQFAAGHEVALALLSYSSEADEDIPEQEADEGNLLAGYLQLLAQPAHQPPRLMVEIAVHPHHRMQGIGRRLQAALLSLAKHYGFKRLDVWAYHYLPDSGAAHFIHKLGMRPSRHLLHMRCTMHPPLSPLTLPEGFSLRSFRPGEDDEEWLSLNRVIFAAHPENGSWTKSDLRLRFEQSWFRAEDFILLLAPNGKIAGFHWTKLHTARLSDLYSSPAYVGQEGLDSNSISGLPVTNTVLGEVYVVGVSPEFQGHKLGKTLTLVGLEHLQKRGATACGLYVDEDNVRAVKLYQSLGFSLHHTDVAYSLDI